MNTNEEILDLLLKRDLILQRVSNGLSKEIASQYIKMIDEAINSLGRVDISLINMNKIIKEINSNIALDYASVEDNFNEVAITEASFIPKAINGIVAVDIMNKTLPDSLVNKIVKNSILSDGYTIKEGFEKLDTKLQETFQNQIRLGVLNGDTTQTIIKNLKPYMADFKDNRIEAMVKTAVSTVVNNTRLETYKQNEEIFKGYQHQSVLDSRTTFICAERDNKQWDLELKPIGHKLPFKNPPLHYRCRSVMLPLTKSYKELGLNIDEIPVGTRSSLNGYVPANTSFSQWFDKQSKVNQEKYLGKGRYQLYKDGKISLSDLVNQKGQTLSIKELKGVSDVPVKATVPKIDFGYGGKFNKYVENIRDEAKIVIDKLPKPNNIGIPSKANKIKVGGYQKNIKELISEDKQSTFLHEYGHHIDNIINKNSKAAYNSQVLFYEPLKKDKEFNNVKNRMTQEELKKSVSTFTTQTPIMYKDRILGIKHTVQGDDNALISDIFDAVYDGQMFDTLGLDGHGAGYFRKDGNKETEIFANMFALWATKSEKLDLVKNSFPNLYSSFIKIIEEI